MDRGQENGIPAEKCAKIILNGIRKNKREVFIARKELVLLYMKRFFPWLFFKIVTRLKF
jgi:short-subunit dehydrogenase